MAIDHVEDALLIYYRGIASSITMFVRYIMYIGYHATQVARGHIGALLGGALTGSFYAYGLRVCLSLMCMILFRGAVLPFVLSGYSCVIGEGQGARRVVGQGARQRQYLILSIYNIGFGLQRLTT